MHSYCASFRLLRQPRSSRARAGFVLVMVLVLLTIAGISLAGLARRSLAMSEQAAAAQSDLQRRWGIRSCLRLYLANAESLLEAEAAKSSGQSRTWPLPSAASSEFSLGNLRFSVLVADEDAKINVNTLFRRGGDGAAQVASVVEQVAGPNGISTQIRPSMVDSKPAPIPFCTWGQIFELETAGPTAELADRLQEATREITCWGGGRLNLSRASDQAVRLVCQDQVSPDVVAKLLAVRQETGINELDNVLTRLGLRLENRMQLLRLLTDQSRWHSVWITARSGRRTWAILALDGGRQNGVAREMFTW